jgi:hypothetical protein
MEGKLIKVSDDDPNRCQSIALNGQCIYKAVEGIKNCPMHAGASQNVIKQEKVRNYRLQKWNRRINEIADSDIIKSLREEIGILRILMEETINKCTDETDLMIYTPRITDLALKIEKVVVSCHKLEESLGQTLDKQKILNISTRIVNIISQHITDERIINLIVDDVGKLISES